ncbi:MAG: hypothetical protein ABSC42_03880 [Tepidisphaeraceae bacterium]|jgi:hypothetical protein
MAQATANSTDELLSQLASSEIDRLLAESDGTPPAPATPAAAETAASAEVVTEGSERAALLEAAGFESPNPAPAEPAKPAPPAEPAPPAQDERAALLEAAGFESVDAPPTNSPAANPPAADAQAVQDPDYVPIYLKPLVWINAPLGACPAIVRQMLGKAGIVTLVNALAILTYVCFFRRH